MQRLLEQGIATRRGIMLAHREAPFQDARGIRALVATELASDNSVLLPLHPKMTTTEVNTVVLALSPVSI
jgi:dTDP-4-amino-4,6-dideoxygalactose transaminase